MFGPSTVMRTHARHRQKIEQDYCYALLGWESTHSSQHSVKWSYCIKNKNKNTAAHLQTVSVDPDIILNAVTTCHSEVQITRRAIFRRDWIRVIANYDFLFFLFTTWPLRAIITTIIRFSAKKIQKFRQAHHCGAFIQIAYFRPIQYSFPLTHPYINWSNAWINQLLPVSCYVMGLPLHNTPVLCEKWSTWGIDR